MQRAVSLHVTRATLEETTALAERSYKDEEREAL